MHQARGAGRELDVEVFGKRVRFERPWAAGAAAGPPRPATDESEDELSWSEDGGDVDFGEVSTAATHGSASSWSSEEEEEEGEERDGGGDSNGDGSDSYSEDGWDTDDLPRGEEGDGDQSGGGDDDEDSPRAFTVRGGGGSSLDSARLAERRFDRRPRRQADEIDEDVVDVGEWYAGFERTTSSEGAADAATAAAGGKRGHPIERAASAVSAEKVEWDAGFGERPVRQPSAPQGRRRRRRRRQRGGSGDDAHDGEWAAGFEVLDDEADASGGGAASADRIEWEEGFDGSEFVGNFAGGRGAGASRGRWGGVGGGSGS